LYERGSIECLAGVSSFPSKLRKVERKQALHVLIYWMLIPKTKILRFLVVLSIADSRKKTTTQRR
jgi:hypothetical protein